MRSLVAFACLVLATPLHAVENRAMSQAEMRAAFFGTTLDGEYSDGLAWSESFDAAGRSVYRQSGARADGRILFTKGPGGDVICFRYERGFAGGCFEVRRRSVNCFDFYGTDGLGAPHASLRQRDGGTGWTARAWRTDAEGTCEAVPVG